MNILENFNFTFDSTKIFGVVGSYFVFAFIILFYLPMMIYVLVDFIVKVVRYHKSKFLKGNK